MMKTFKSFITEGAKNTHLEHIEEEILNSGLSGGHQAITTLQSILNNLAGSGSSHTTLTTKWDGSMAMFAGIDPESKKFFVGTKAVLSKEPKLNFTYKDIDKNYADNPQVANMLKFGLKYLPNIGIKNVLQGDLLFTKDMLKMSNVDGEPMVLFQPNTVVYGVPIHSEMGQSIAKASIGIVWHTSYSGGPKVSNMKASFKVNIKNLIRNSNVWFDDAYLKDVTGSVHLTKSETQRVFSLLKKATVVLGKCGSVPNQLMNSPIVPHIKQFSNMLIRTGKQMDSSNVDQLIDHISTKYKSDAGRNKALAIFKENSKEILAIFQFQSLVVEAKNILLNKLNQISSIGTFVETSDGYEVSPGEGFVAIDNKTGKVVKLVDRLTFSRMNFSRHGQ